MLREFALVLAAGLFVVACSPTATSPPPSASISSAPSPTQVASPELTQQPSATQAVVEGLLIGIRADVRATDCQQIQGDLPPPLVEVVVCEVGSELVDRVTFARYSTLDSLMAFYEARLAAHGISLATDVGPAGETPEDCWRGFASESFYSPAGVASETNREGCFVDENGHASQLYVWGRALVLITVESSTEDIAGLKAWSWYDANGDEPALGGPGLWQPRS